MRISTLCLFFTLAAGASDRSANLTVRDNLAPRPMLFNLTDRIIPQVVTGGGWTTTFFLTNLGTVDYKIDLHFYADDGKPLSVSFPDYRLIGPDFVVTLPAGTSISAELDDSPVSPTRQGWAILADPIAKISGWVILRQRIAGRGDFEALVPLSSISDRQFTLGFDNRKGYATGVALANPTALNLPATALLTFVDSNDQVLTTDAITLPPSGHTAFTVHDRYPATDGKFGLLRVFTDASRLSGMGLRFNPGGAFTSMHTLSTQ